jgi:putative protease
MSEVKVGRVTHYFGHLQVAVFEITDGELNVGDTVRIAGHTTDVTQPVETMQVEHQTIPSAKAGQSVGVKVNQRVRKHDVVFKVLPG